MQEDCRVDLHCAMRFNRASRHSCFSTTSSTATEANALGKSGKRFPETVRNRTSRSAAVHDGIQTGSGNRERKRVLTITVLDLLARVAQDRVNTSASMNVSRLLHFG